GEQEVVAHDVCDLLRLEGQQLADAVVLVHDVVARAEVGERLECARTGAALARRSLAENLRVREQDEAELAPDEATARGRDGEQELGFARQPFAVLEDARLDATEEVLLSQGLAAVRERDEHAMPCADECCELVLRFREPASDERGPLSFERKRLP